MNKYEMERNDICKLCFESFGDTNRPRCLHCGHSYCTDCLDKLIKNRNLSCPKCKRDHQIRNARDFPINYDLEECLSDARRSLACISTKPPSNTKITKLQTLICEQKDSIHSLIVATEDAQSQLKEYDEFLRKKNEKHEEVLQKIRDLANIHEVLITEIKEERIKIKDMQKEGNKYREETKDKIPTLDNATTNKATAVAVAELVECIGELEGWIERCQQDFPYHRIAFSQQVLEESMDALSSVVSERDENVPVFSGSPENDLTILEKVNTLGDKPSLSVERLRRQAGYWKTRIAAGRVYASSRSNNGRKRSANVSERDGNIYLHYLQDKEAPLLSHTIEHSEVVKSLDKDSTVAFMDLSWDGSFKGRVHILLSPDTILARHFRILCTGDFGPSYAHTQFHDVAFKGECNECLRGGDYQCSDGTGGIPVMEGLDTFDEIYDRSCETGIVYATPKASDQQRAQFSITTGFGRISLTSNVFGAVQDGMDVLKAAVRFRNIKEVKIIDCGVVLSL